MSIEVIVTGKNGKGARVINGGALAVLPPHYNQIFSKKLDVIGGVFNLVPAKAGNYFVGNVLVLTANKNVGVNDATVNVYSAAAADEALGADNTEFLPIEMIRQSTVTVPNMNIRTLEKGAYINCVTDEVDIYVTLFGYYTSED